MLQKAQQEAAEAKAQLARQQTIAPVVRQQAVMQHAQMSIEKLPLPTPQTMRDYGQFAPDVVEMLKTEQRARHDVQKHVQRMDERAMDLAMNDQKHEADSGRRGQWMAFFVFGLGMLTSAFLAHDGSPWLAGGTFLADIAAVVGLFLRSDATARKVAEARASQLPPPPGTDLAPPKP